jgi:heat shock protein HslJ
MKHMLLTMLFIAGLDMGSMAQQRTILVAPYKVTCSGVAPMQCLQYKYKSSDPWMMMYQDIEGFTFESGFEYTLLINEHQVQNAPADASSIHRKLIRIISKQKAMHQNEQSLQGPWLIQQLLVDGVLTNVQSLQYYFHIGDSTFVTKICNTMRGALLLQGSGIASSGRIAGTKMMCPNMAHETALTQVLGLMNGYTEYGNQLSLMQNNKVSAVLIRDAAYNATTTATAAQIDVEALLEQTTYRILQLADAKGTADLRPTKATIKFDRVNRRVSGFGGCNQFFAQAEIQFVDSNSGTITVSKGGSTLMACPQFMDLEQRLLQTLEQVDRFEMKGGKLFLQKGHQILIELAE